MKDPDNIPLEQQLRSVEAAKERSYDKRTEHFDEAGKALFINRLILEDSPYLLQHAHNPVNWFPWGEEAFATAVLEDKPVFLSIGYSTCHWCHVMEVESFDNIEVAKVLNRDFISIKMDREQYPDIDEIYMTAVQLISGQGGWPMSNFLMPDGKPFFAATYFPPANFLQLLAQIGSAWTERRDELEASAASVQAAVQRILGNKPSGESSAITARQLVEALVQREDSRRGGLAGAPKFPQEPILLYLLEYAAREQSEEALGFVVRALHGMGRGGIYDQVGGGFHRYSVDADWLVPHFEKMLYNQSQLGLVYLRAWMLSGEPFFARICKQTLDYVLRDMELAEGGYYSATDADSEGSEGTFFLWTPAQVESALSPEQAALVIDVFGVSRLGNFEGANILNLEQSLQDLQLKYGENFLQRLDAALSEMYRVREQRIHPIRDDKRIVAWCAAMASTLIQSGVAMGEMRWVESARKALDHMLASNVNKEGELTRIYLGGEVSIAAQLEDYVNLVQALILLFDATESPAYLQRGQELMMKALVGFWDEVSGSFFLSPAQQRGPVLVRSRSAGDGAELSAVATALDCLWMLEQRNALLGKQEAIPDFAAIRETALRNLQPLVDDSPLNHCSIMRVQTQAESASFLLTQYGDGGLIRCDAQRRHDTSSVAKLIHCNMRCRVAEPWHLTAADEASAKLRPLRLELADAASWKLESVNYPQASGTLKSAGFEVAINSGDIEIEFTVSSRQESPGPLEVRLHYQLCDDAQCLLPGVFSFLL
jgi:uncharacterized protein YyaL (SSP411 family)